VAPDLTMLEGREHSDLGADPPRWAAFEGGNLAEHGGDSAADEAAHAPEPVCRRWMRSVPPPTTLERPLWPTDLWAAAHLSGDALHPLSRRRRVWGSLSEPLGYW